MSIDVAEVPMSSRFELRRDGEAVAWVDYHLDGEVHWLDHVRVLPRYRHQGLATRLVRAVLDEIGARGERVVPACPFVRAVIEWHPEYRPLVAGEAPAATCPWLGMDAQPQ